MIGGYAIFDLQGPQEALACAREFMQVHKDHMPGWEGTCEVRAIAGSMTKGGNTGGNTGGSGPRPA